MLTAVLTYILVSEILPTPFPISLQGWTASLQSANETQVPEVFEL